MIDWAQVKELHDEVGPEDFEELVTLFLQEVDEVAERLGKAPDPSRLREDLHFLKGGALNIGFEDFAKACAEGEGRASSGEAHRVDVPQIIDLYRISRNRFLADLPDRMEGQTSL